MELCLQPVACVGYVTIALQTCSGYCMEESKVL